MEAKVLISTKNMSEEDWLNNRQKGIGGSDVAAIAGLNKWKTSVGVYLDKTGQAPEQKIDSEAAYWGHIHEETVAKEFSKRTGLKVRNRNAILQHPEHTFMLANVDRLIVGHKEGLECKTASEWLKNEWIDDEVPASYRIQCQHYMAVTGYKAWWIAVLIGGNKFVHKKIERDEEIIDYLIDIESDFWNNHVLKEIPPAFDGSNASSDLLNLMYPESFSDEVELPMDADELLIQLDEAKREEKEAQERKKEAENKLKAMLGENEVGLASNNKIIWKTVKSNRFDSKAFRNDHPDLHKKYIKISNSRRFSVK